MEIAACFHLHTMEFPTTHAHSLSIQIHGAAQNLKWSSGPESREEAVELMVRLLIPIVLWSPQ